MPKTVRMTDQQRELSDQIRKQFGGAHVLTVQQVMEVIGAKSRNTAVKWLEPLVPRYYDESRCKKRWLVCDVAKKLDEGI